MASAKPPLQEAIVCVRVPSREGKERVWQAIELLRRTVPGQASLKHAALYARVSTDKQEREDTVASQVERLNPQTFADVVCLHQS